MRQHIFVVCIDNASYQASLEVRKLYEVLPDEEAAKHEQVRVVDESSEDYPYPKSLFVLVEVPSATESLLLRAA